MDKTEHKLDVCKRTRAFAAASLHSVLGKMLSSGETITELSLHEKWLAEMRKSDSIEKDGWYMPPRNGIGVIFATDDNCGRLHHKSLRKMEPQAGIELDMKKRGGICVCISRRQGNAHNRGFWNDILLG